jgi:hypothetical protein
MHLLLGKGRRTVDLSLSGADLGQLRRGLRAHKLISASVYGAIVDSGGNVERLSRGRRLRITG